MAIRFPAKSTKEFSHDWEEQPDRKSARRRRIYVVEKRLKDGEEAFGVTHDEWRSHEHYKTHSEAEIEAGKLRRHHYWQRFEIRVVYDYED